MEESGIFIIGANGQLGTALRQQYPKAKFADISELDITDKKSVFGYDWSSTHTILNAAAYTNVDGAESPEGRTTAWKVNAIAVSYLSEVARNHGITLVHVSTEYIFDGTVSPHTEDESYSPLSVYGSTKAASEIAVASCPTHYIFRVSWLIGEGKNFVRTMLGVGEKGISPKVVSDQIGRLTFTTDLVRAIDHVLTTKAAYGTYNLSGDGDEASWADITRKIFEYAGFKDLSVTNITTQEYFTDKPEAALRPLLSAFDLSKIKSTGFEPTKWDDDLKNYIAKELAK